MSIINMGLGVLVIGASTFWALLFLPAPRGRHRRGPWGLQWLWRSTKKG
jgi:hypothetical protein